MRRHMLISRLATDPLRGQPPFGTASLKTWFAATAVYHYRPLSVVRRSIFRSQVRTVCLPIVDAQNGRYQKGALHFPDQATVAQANLFTPLRLGWGWHNLNDLITLA